MACGAVDSPCMRDAHCSRHFHQLHFTHNRTTVASPCGNAEHRLLTSSDAPHPPHLPPAPSCCCHHSLPPCAAPPHLRLDLRFLTTITITMEEQPKRQWGVTQAISHAAPKDEELKLNDKLVAALTAENNFETPEQTKARYVSTHPLSATLADTNQTRSPRTPP